MEQERNTMIPNLSEKRCTKCGKIYPATTEYFHNTSTHKDKLSSQCKICLNSARRTKERTPSIKKTAKKVELKFLYGLTRNEYEQMYLQQHGCCAICKTPIGLTEINVDHDHKTGKVKGLLCSGCNIFITFVRYFLNQTVESKMSTHKPAQGGHKINKQARYQRKLARRKMFEGLQASPRTGYVSTKWSRKGKAR